MTCLLRGNKRGQEDAHGTSGKEEGEALLYIPQKTNSCVLWGLAVYKVLSCTLISFNPPNNTCFTDMYTEPQRHSRTGSQACGQWVYGEEADLLDSGHISSFQPTGPSLLYKNVQVSNNLWCWTAKELQGVGCCRPRWVLMGSRTFCLWYVEHECTAVQWSLLPDGFKSPLPVSLWPLSEACISISVKGHFGSVFCGRN